MVSLILNPFKFDRFLNLKAFTNFVREQHELWEIALKLLKALHTAPEKIEQKYKSRVIEVKRSF